MPFMLVTDDAIHDEILDRNSPVSLNMRCLSVTPKVFSIDRVGLVEGRGILKHHDHTRDGRNIPVL